MKNKSAELEVDFIGGERPLTKEDENAISDFIRTQKAQQSQQHSTIKRTISTKRRSVSTS